MARVSFSFFFVSSLLLVASVAQPLPPLANGLSFDFYNKTCPNLETIVRNHLKKVFKIDNGQAPGLLRIMFHDCFVSGCDGSLLLDAKPGEESERDQGSNIGIRVEALKTIDVLRALVHKECGRIVSCADLTVLAARDAVSLSGGPSFRVPLGRRDGLIINTRDTAKLPSPFSKTPQVTKAFTDRKVFDVTDVVAFSGAHTFGRAHCATFSDRIFPLDPKMEKKLAKNLTATCPNSNSTNTANLDIRTPTLFDNQYYVDLMNRQGVFTSDQDLFNDPTTTGIVTAFAKDQSLFFSKFALAMVKLSQLDVLTGNQGEIRAKCNLINKKQSVLESMVEEVAELSEQF